MNSKIIFVISIDLLLSGCNPTKPDVGTVIGAGTGAYVGSQVGNGSGQRIENSAI